MIEAEELSLWALLFILYLGVIWITILDKLKQIEKLLRASPKPDNDKNKTPEKV